MLIRPVKTCFATMACRWSIRRSHKRAITWWVMDEVGRSSHGVDIGEEAFTLPHKGLTLMDTDFGRMKVSGLQKRTAFGFRPL